MTLELCEIRKSVYWVLFYSFVEVKAHRTLKTFGSNIIMFSVIVESVIVLNIIILKDIF